MPYSEKEFREHGAAIVHLKVILPEIREQLSTVLKNQHEMAKIISGNGGVGLAEQVRKNSTMIDKQMRTCDTVQANKKSMGRLVIDKSLQLIVMIIGGVALAIILKGG